jgi:vacuolar-type H+-ATPase subunit E/Vma4
VNESVEKEKVLGTSDASAIISGIETDGRAEEQLIIKEAQELAAEKRKFTEKKIESVLNEAHNEAQQQAQVAKRKIISGLQIELKRRSMHIRETVMRQIQDEVEKKLDAMTGNANYRSILIDWIIEAAVGLGTEFAQINASEKELAFINDQLISEVSEKIRTKTGRQITLQLSQEPALKFQGIVLTAADGHTAFNNQVRTRILRKEREIRMTIYNTLFVDERKE